MGSSYLTKTVLVILLLFYGEPTSAQMSIRNSILEIEKIFQLHGTSIKKGFREPIETPKAKDYIEKIEKEIGYKIALDVIELYSVGDGDGNNWPSLFPCCEWLPLHLLLSEYKTINENDYFGLKMQQGIKFRIRKESYYEDSDNDAESNFEIYHSINHLLPIGYHAEPGWLFVDLSEENYGRLIVSSVVGDAGVIAPSLLDYLTDIINKVRNGTYPFNPEEGIFEMPESWYEKQRISN